jgi:hypothetical protein
METVAKMIEAHWPKKVIGLLVLPLTVFVFSFPALAAVTPEKYFAYAVIASLLISGASVSIWCFTTRLRRHPKGTVGFDLVIYHEDEKQGIRIQSDFIKHLRDLVLSEKSDTKFSFIKHSQYVSSNVVDRDSAVSLATKTRGSFVIFGKTKIRNIHGLDQHVIEIGFCVRHSPIDVKISEKIAEEMRNSLTGELVLAQENDLYLFRINAERIEIGSKYIVALAALVSGDLIYSETLFRSLIKRLKDVTACESSETAKIRERLPSRLGEIGILRCHKLSQEYVFRNPDSDLLKKLDQDLDRYEEYIHGWYNWYLLKAMCHFLLRRDLDGAQKLISSCKRFPDTTWRYSAAFLAAYSGDLQTAWSHYQKAFANPPSDPSVPNQCESFIKGILEIEPHQYQLWYCLGLINFRAKNDLEAARNDFRVFLQHTEKSKFSPQEKIAAKYIRKIESELKTNRIAA